MSFKVDLGPNGELKLASLTEAIELVRRERDFFSWLANVVPPNQSVRENSPSRVAREGWQRIHDAAEAGDLEATKEALSWPPEIPVPQT